MTAVVTTLGTLTHGILIVTSEHGPVTSVTNNGDRDGFGATRQSRARPPRSMIRVSRTHGPLLAATVVWAQFLWSVRHGRRAAPDP